MPNETSITFIGSGNLAWHLAPALEKTGYGINAIYSRDLTNAAALAKRLKNCIAVDHLDFSSSPSSIFIVAVPDKAIGTVAKQLKLNKDAIVVHTSGTTAMEVLGSFKNRGVLYPLQTFSKNKKIDFSSVPLFIEASNDYSKTIIATLAQSVFEKHCYLSSEKRSQLHLAAVFSCNFNNHMLHMAKNIADSNDIPFQLLAPLVQETIDKAFDIGPENAQTGPAIRLDHTTMDAHKAMLEDNPELKEIYITLSHHIINQNKAQ
jgi:predicted short-subunit dehydrogenase-like oxidoreductase (DUF2520 family)